MSTLGKIKKTPQISPHEDTELIKNTIAQGATQDELKTLLYLCKEYTYRDLLCKHYNALINRAIEVNLLLHDWHYENGIVTGSNAPSYIKLIHYYTSTPLPYGYRLEHTYYHH